MGCNSNQNCLIRIIGLPLNETTTRISLLERNLVRLSTGQCYLYYSCAVCTVLLIKYKITNLVNHLIPFTKIILFKLYERQTRLRRRKRYKVISPDQVTWLIPHASDHYNYITSTFCIF
jgi:hypothetical protein